MKKNKRHDLEHVSEELHIYMYKTQSRISICNLDE